MFSRLSDLPMIKLAPDTLICGSPKPMHPNDAGNKRAAEAGRKLPKISFLFLSQSRQALPPNFRFTSFTSLQKRWFYNRLSLNFTPFNETLAMKGVLHELCSRLTIKDGLLTSFAFSHTSLLNK